MLKKIPLMITLLLLCHISHAASDSLRAPIATQQMHPIMMRFFNPVPVSAFDMGSSVQLEQSYASLNMYDTLPNAKFLVDTELYVPTLNVRRALNAHHLLSIRVPLYRPYNGVLDGFLTNYHQLVGLPNNGRQFRPSNQMAYYLHPEWSADNRWELGNISLELQSQLYKKNDIAVAIVSAVYLPTASKARGWSSGAVDLSLGATAAWYGDAYFSHAELRAIRTGASSTGSLTYRNYLRSSATIGRDLGSRCSALIQIQGGNSPYQSNLFVLEQNPLIMTFGLRIQGESALYSFNFSENLTQYTTADFSFGFNIRWLIDKE